MESIPLLNGGSRTFLLAARDDQRGVQVDDQPACQQFPAHGQPRGTRPASHRSATRRARGPGPAPGRPCPGSAGRPAPVSAAPWCRPARPRTAVPGVPAGDVVHAGRPERDRHRHGNQRDTPVHQRELPGPRQRPAHWHVSPARRWFRRMHGEVRRPSSPVHVAAECLFALRSVTSTPCRLGSHRSAALMKRD